MAISRSRRVDGIWLGIASDKSGDPVLDRVESALGLIKQYDAIRYRRVMRDVERIWVKPLIGARGQFSSTFKRCALDHNFVVSASPEAIASTIVHEATHGHVWLRKFGYPEALRPRIEKICFRQQLLFLEKVNADEEVSAGVKRNLARPTSFWSDKDFQSRREDEAFRAAKSYGTPLWLVKLILKTQKLQNLNLRKKYFGRRKNFRP